MWSLIRPVASEYRFCERMYRRSQVDHFSEHTLSIVVCEGEANEKLGRGQKKAMNGARAYPYYKPDVT